MELDLELARFGLDFYGVTDDAYRAGILKCADTLLRDPEKKGRFEEIVTVLHEKEEKIVTSHPSIGELFGFDLPFLSHLALLIGARHHEKIMMQRGYDAEQWNIQMERFHRYLSSVNSKEPLPNLSVLGLVWTSYFSNGRLIQVGRLQYEACPDSVHIHIPAAGSFDFQSVEDSLRRAYPKAKQYFGIEEPVFRCSSWLLSPEIASFLKEGSNILKFQSVFDLHAGKATNTGVYSFLFKVPSGTPFEQLPENTSLQRAVKEYLLAGKEIHNGIGFVKPEFLHAN